MKLVLFDDQGRKHLLPLAFTRPVCEFRLGIRTIREKWEHALNAPSTTYCADYLAASLWPFQPAFDTDNIWINSRVIPSLQLAAEVKKLQVGEALLKGDLLVAANVGLNSIVLKLGTSDHLTDDFSMKESMSECMIIHRMHDLFSHNGKAILWDLEDSLQTPAKLSATNTVIGTHGVFCEGDFQAACVTFNTTQGPIFIGKDAEIMEGSHLRGPLAIGKKAVIKMGAKIYGDTTIGPGCKVGGEITNTVFFGNSNKAHDGYVGNSIIGEWCNLGADTNTSNLKNNYSEVDVFNYAIGASESTGLTFHGLIMGDHAKCGINTMFNTGTVVGVGANVFGAGFPPKFIPDFCWGGADGFTTHLFPKMIETLTNVYKRRKLEPSNEEIAMLQHVFNQTAHWRDNVL